MATAMIHPNNIEFMKQIFDRDNISDFEFYEDKGMTKVRAPISNSHLASLIDDMRCEKQSLKYGGLPVYTLDTLRHPRKLKRLQKLNGTTAFVPFARDSEKIAKEFLQM